MSEFAILRRRQRAMQGLESLYDPTRDTVKRARESKMGEETRQEQVARAAGLSSLHGGSGGRTVLRWEGACPAEEGSLFVVSRIWDGSKGELPDDIPLECPLCGEEHMLPRKT